MNSFSSTFSQEHILFIIHSIRRLLIVHSSYRLDDDRNKQTNKKIKTKTTTTTTKNCKNFKSKNTYYCFKYSFLFIFFLSVIYKCNVSNNNSFIEIILFFPLFSIFINIICCLTLLFRKIRIQIDNSKKTKLELKNEITIHPLWKNPYSKLKLQVQKNN